MPKFLPFYYLKKKDCTYDVIVLIFIYVKKALGCRLLYEDKGHTKSFCYSEVD